MEKFAGQWLGRFEGTNLGFALLDLDHEDEHLEGMVYAYDSDMELPSICGSVVVEPEAELLKFTVKPQPIHPTEPRFALLGEFNGILPAEVSVSLSLNGDRLSGHWSTDAETKGSVDLRRSKASTASLYTPDTEIVSWDTFQSKVSKLAKEPYRYIFRGQAAPWRLRTSFHRTNRKDLWRYWNDDIPRVRHASIGVGGQVFDRLNADHNGAFMHLLQHHGYPTPMLDWTYSPYIAAFFAYSSASPDAKGGPPMRIFMFDAEEWRADYNQLLHITLCKPHFSLLEPVALRNPRALPQQSVAAITNLDDIETYIRLREEQSGKQYLRVFDLDPLERNSALRQLGLMGISPGSMFPGIEGVCREYRDRHFGYRF